jgi:hypothetical protein
MLYGLLLPDNCWPKKWPNFTKLFQIVDEPPEYIIWHHEDRMLNYDTERGGIRSENMEI